MKSNTKKNRLRTMDKEQLIKRLNYLGSKRLPGAVDSNMMKYIRYHLRTRFDHE